MNKEQPPEFCKRCGHKMLIHGKEGCGHHRIITKELTKLKPKDPRICRCKVQHIIGV